MLESIGFNPILKRNGIAFGFNVGNGQPATDTFYKEGNFNVFLLYLNK